MAKLRCEIGVWNSILGPLPPTVHLNGRISYLGLSWPSILFITQGLGISPFKALYGREPPSLEFPPPSAATPPSVAELILQRSELLVELRGNSGRAQQRMQDTANKHRHHVEFAVGNRVLLK